MLKDRGTSCRLEGRQPQAGRVSRERGCRAEGRGIEMGGRRRGNTAGKSKTAKAEKEMNLCVFTHLIL